MSTVSSFDVDWRFHFHDFSQQAFCKNTQAQFGLAKHSHNQAECSLPLSLFYIHSLCPQYIKLKQVKYKEKTFNKATICQKLRDAKRERWEVAVRESQRVEAIMYLPSATNKEIPTQISLMIIYCGDKNIILFSFSPYVQPYLLRVHIPTTNTLKMPLLKRSLQICLPFTL